MRLMVSLSLLAISAVLTLMPSAALSQNCRWDGTAPFCNGSCGGGETEVTRHESLPDFWEPPFANIPEFGATCVSGTKALCCATAGVTCRWDGTAPFCEGECRPGEQVGQPPPGSSSGAGCVTGSKVYCCRTNAAQTTLPLVVGAPQSFRSVNFPDHFIRHAFSLGEISKINTPLDRADSTFIVRPGLSGTSGAVSFESVNFPGHFLRHQSFRVKLHANDGSDLFRKDASFLTRQGLADAAAVSYESVNMPNHFMRHRDFHLVVDVNDGSQLFQKDASFRKEPPNQ